MSALETRVTIVSDPSKTPAGELAAPSAPTGPSPIPKRGAKITTHEKGGAIEVRPGLVIHPPGQDLAARGVGRTRVQIHGRLPPPVVNQATRVQLHAGEEEPEQVAEPARAEAEEPAAAEKIADELEAYRDEEPAAAEKIADATDQACRDLLLVLKAGPRTKKAIVEGARPLTDTLFRLPHFDALMRLARAIESNEKRETLLSILDSIEE